MGSFKVLHLNIERDKHLKEVKTLIRDKEPDIICLEEVLDSSVRTFSKEFGYETVYSPLISREGDTQGSAILSKFPIVASKEDVYGDNKTKFLIEAKNTPDGKRPENRFLYHFSLLSANLDMGQGGRLNVATTHFPVVDHETRPLGDHVLDEFEEVVAVEHARDYLDRLIAFIRRIESPLIFTADLNNNRGEYAYDALAHELQDLVPQDTDSTLDPQLHRRKDLKLVVDTIMTTPDIEAENVEIISGVSDHKAIFATIET